MEINEGISNTTESSLIEQRERGAFEIPIDFFEQYAFVGNMIVTPIICFVGLCGNGLGAYVLWKDCRHQKLSVYRYMLALMIFDNFYLLLGLASSAFSVVMYYDWYLGNRIITYFSFAAGYLDLVLYHTSSILLTVMALERLNALVRPFTVRHHCLSKYPLKIIVTVFIISVLYIIPYPFSFEVIRFDSPQNNTILYLQIKPDIAEFYDKYSFGETLISCCYPIVMLIINIAIPIAYRRVLRRRKMDLPNMSSQETQQLKVTLMILWIAVLYVLLAVPKIFLQTLIFVDSDYDFDGKYNLTFYFFVFTGDIMARLNAANDFFVYVFVSERYRKILRYMFCRRCVSTDQYINFSDIFRPSSQHLSRVNSSYLLQSAESKRNTQISVLDGASINNGII